MLQRNQARGREKPKCSCTCRCTQQRHPLVNVKRLADADAAVFDSCYTAVLRGRVESNRCGKLPCDFQDCTVSFFKPHTFGKHVHELKTEDGCVLGFRKELFTGLENPVCIECYTFFNYSFDESLHVSAREQETLLKSMSDISGEQDWGTDKYTRGLVAERVRIFLEYCLRYYDRQFVTRRDAAAQPALNDVAKVAEEYILRERSCTAGTAALVEFAARYKVSPAYFADLLRHETGFTLAEYLRQQRVRMAKERLQRSDLPVQEIVATLGFGSVRYFNALFKELEGCTPTEFRRSC